MKKIKKNKKTLQCIFSTLELSSRNQTSISNRYLENKELDRRSKKLIKDDPTNVNKINCYIHLIKYNHTKFKFKTNQTLIWKTIFLIKTKKKIFFNNNRNI